MFKIANTCKKEYFKIFNITPKTISSSVCQYLKLIMQYVEI